jgi:deoxyadenosine/deoxycytidine kinase
MKVKLSTVRIEIAGGIASGKTTLARLLAKVQPTLTVVEEQFEYNPLWSRFSVHAGQFVREKNASFLAQHVAEIKAARGGNTVCDFAVFQDLAYASLEKDERHLEAMRGLYTDLYGRVPPPAAIVHLMCSPLTEMERLRSRGRSQEKTLTLDYLQRVNAAIGKFAELIPSPTSLIAIDADSVDFRNCSAKTLELVNLVLTKAHGDREGSICPV